MTEKNVVSSFFIIVCIICLIQTRKGASSRSSANTASADFWIAHEHLYPILLKVALDLIAASASQVYTEQIFSVGLCGDKTSRKRNRLAAGLEHRVFLKMNAKYFQFFFLLAQHYLTVGQDCTL